MMMMMNDSSCDLDGMDSMMDMMPMAGMKVHAFIKHMTILLTSISLHRCSFTWVLVKDYCLVHGKLLQLDVCYDIVIVIVL